MPKHKASLIHRNSSYNKEIDSIYLDSPSLDEAKKYFFEEKKWDKSGAFKYQLKIDEQVFELDFKGAPKISISIHNGLYERWPLLENIIKSFLVCNEYPNIELILAESGGNSGIRAWLENLDLDDYFVDLQGQKTDIIKNPNVTIEKSLKFIDFDESIQGLGACYSRAINQSIQHATGDFFVNLAEDNQFIIKGNIIEDYLQILKHYGSHASAIHFFSQQQYKLYKQNNQATGPHSIDSTQLPFFMPTHQKWDPNQLVHKSIFKNMESQAGEENTKEASYDVHHGFVQRYTNLFTECAFQRIYPAIPAGVWMTHAERTAAEIAENKKSNPNYIRYKIKDKEELLRIVRSQKPTHPFSSEKYSIDN